MCVYINWKFYTEISITSFDYQHVRHTLYFKHIWKEKCMSYMLANMVCLLVDILFVAKEKELQVIRISKDK